MENLIRRLKKEQGLSNKEIAELIGKNATSVSEYLNNHRQIPIDVKKIISERLGIQPPKVYESELESVTISEVAQRMGRSENMVRLAIQQGKLPFAVAVKGTGDAFQYWIFRGSFEKFISENKT